MVRQLDDLDERAVRRRAGHLQPRRLQRLAALRVVVELVAVTVAFGDREVLLALLAVGGRVEPRRERALPDDARVRAEAHRAALLRDALLRLHEVDDGMRRLRIELRRVRIRPADDIARVLDRRTLHPQADAEERDLVFTRILDREALARHAAAAEAARHEDAVHALEERRILLQLLRLDALHVDLAVMRHARMVQGLVDRLVGVADRDVLADERDRAALLRLCRLLHERIPHRVLDRPDVEVQLLQHLFVQPLLAEFARDRVDGVRHVPLLDDALGTHVAEERKLGKVFLRDRHLRAAHKDVGDDADGAELPDGMLRGLRLQLARRLQVGNEREVDEARVVAALLEAELPRRLQERQRLDVARDAADLAEDDVAVMLAGGLDGVLDLVRDVRHHLHRTSQVAARALARKNDRVDAPRRVVRRLRAGHPREALVVAEVEVRLRPVVRHEHLAVLVRAHRARIDV